MEGTERAAVSQKTITVDGEERQVFICELMSRGKRCGTTYTDEIVMLKHLARMHRDVRARHEVERFKANSRFG